MERLLISACLLGFPCKYSGGDNALPAQTLAALRRRFRLIPVCPELAGGLGVPREPSERRGDRVLSADGRDVTEQFRRGARIALRLARRFGCKRALLKANSLSGRLVDGDGVTAELLKRNDLEIYNALEKLL